MTTQTKRSTMKTTVITGVLLTSLIASPGFATDSNHIELAKRQILTEQDKKDNENIGFGTGLAVGALVAGPIGAMVTGILGVFTAKHYNVTSEKELLTAQLGEEKQGYEQALVNYQQKLAHVEQSYQQELLALRDEQQIASQLQAENLLMSLQFSTGSSEIKPHYQEQIVSLAKLVAQSPKLSIDLSGYTDMQGSDDLNHALSIARVNAVKAALIAQGIAPERINLFAFGEQAPVVANNEKEVSFYDRRVVIKLQPMSSATSNQQTVSNF